MMVQQTVMQEARLLLRQQQQQQLQEGRPLQLPRPGLTAAAKWVVQQQLEMLGLALVLLLVLVGVHGSAAGGLIRRMAAIFLQAGWWQTPRLCQVSKSTNRSLGWTLGSCGE
jgi:hypothetical protein